ncbi:hypothetical protein ABGB07_04005 [Micromonosporaceae bacterium B7E4]
MTEYSSPAPEVDSIDVPDVAKFAGWLAEWMLDRPISPEAEEAAETVSNYLRSLVEPRILPCPAYCQTDHVAEAKDEEELRCRLHEVRFPAIEDEGRHIASVSVASADGLDTGHREAPVVLLETKDGLTADQAVALSDYLLMAASVIRTGSTEAVDALATIAGTDAEAALSDVAKVAEAASKAAPVTSRAWCVGETNRTCDGTDCMSAPVDVLATAGVKAGVDGGGVRVPMVSTYAQTDENGQPGVHVYVTGPISLDEDREAWAVLTPAEARRYAAELMAHADLAERA